MMCARKCLALGGWLMVAGLSLTCNPFAKKPSVPVVMGPETGVAGVPLTFKATSEDPDGDSVAFMFDWGDTTTKVWTDFILSGETISVSHTYTDSGSCIVKAEAKNGKGRESGWSVGTDIELLSAGPGYPDSLVRTMHLPYGTKRIAISQDGQYLYSLSTLETSVFIASTGAYAIVDSVGVGGVPRSMAVSPDGSFLYVAVPDLDSVVIIRTEDHAVVSKFAAGREPSEIAITPNGDFAYVVCGDSIRVWRTSDLSIVATLAPNRAYPDIQISPDGAEVYVTSSVDSTLVVFNAVTNSVQRTLHLPACGTAVGVSCDGDKLYVGNDDSKIRVISVADWAIVGEIAVLGLVSQIVATPDSEYVLAANFDGRGFPVIRTELDMVVDLLTPGWPVGTIAVSPDGDRIFGSTHEGVTCVFGRR